ncbi:MAG: hypothetical protein ABGZ17_27900 [Planctomycetaceae bacterium]
MAGNMHPYKLLVGVPELESKDRAQLQTDFDAFARQGLPECFDEYLLDRFQIDVQADYGGFPLSNPWGKASGQLSMTSGQVAEDVEAGLGFIVLKTLIAEDEAGGQSMKAWAVKESKMVAERILGKDDESGWTISWKGRGWWQSLDDYLQLVRDARSLARERGVLIVPSCKYHLPLPGESEWRESEYRYTTQKLYEAWFAGEQSVGLWPLEKDFSPTLAGSDRASVEEQILEWLRKTPNLIRDALPGQTSTRVGLKLFNALFDDEFQLKLLQTIHEAGAAGPDFFVYGNRLFDPHRAFDGHTGIAYGGPELSRRNLTVMSRFHDTMLATTSPTLRWSATGDICTGQIALEYALRGASSFQLHTFFQLPSSEYTMQVGHKSQKALLQLNLDPRTGFIPWLLHVARRLGLSDRPLRFLDVVGQMDALR